MTKPRKTTKTAKAAEPDADGTAATNGATPAAEPEAVAVAAKPKRTRKTKADEAAVDEEVSS